MSAARRENDEAVGGRTVDDIADELYSVRPDEFVAARDEYVRAARGEGQKAAARALGSLRRPTQSAWLINMLSRHEPDTVEELLGLAESFGQALASGDGRGLQSLSAQRRTLEGRLISRARALGKDSGVNVTADMAREIQETLAAAVSSADVASDVRTGRVVKPSSYTGFGIGFPDVGDAAPPRKAEAKPVKPAKAKKGEGDDDAAAKRREAAEKRVREAQEDLEVAAHELGESERAAAVAEERRAELDRRRDDLEDRLRRLRDELAEVEEATAAVEEEATTTRRRRERAQRVHDRAARELDEASQQLESMT